MYINVAEQININFKSDISDDLQELIDNNPNRVIFFPDGEYKISKPIMTPADPEFAVSLKLSDFAIIKANEDWCSDEAVIRLGGKLPKNDNKSNCSNYGLDGGIIDCSGVAKGISIESGRETYIRNTSVKNSQVGIHIKRGANNGSSDADLTGINIVGNYAADSIGILIECWDNTLTNIRISRINTGVKLVSAGNILRNVHPLYYFTNMKGEYHNSVAFDLGEGGNHLDYCYSDQFAVAFLLDEKSEPVMQNCFVWYYDKKYKRHTGIKTKGKFNAIVSNFKIGFIGEENENVILDVGEEGGMGIIDNLGCNEKRFITDNTFKKYLKGTFICN